MKFSDFQAPVGTLQQAHCHLVTKSVPSQWQCSQRRSFHINSSFIQQIFSSASAMAPCILISHHQSNGPTNACI